MDGSSVASEIPDLLENIYRFPLCSSSESSYSPQEDPYRVPFQRYYKLTKKNNSKSNSLILKETTEKSFSREQSPSTELTYRAYNISDTKGGLKTYLTKSSKPPQKRLKKKTQPTKKIHSTISNQDNSLYLVVSRQESDKVYEIKTSVTGSATLLKIKPDTYSFKSNENVSVKNSHKSSKILESVNMEKKKREVMPDSEETKANRSKEGNRSAGTRVQFGRETTVCHCPFITKSTKKKLNNLIPVPTDNNRSRVKITGRLGLTEDDKYVLNCAATIDDQPVETHYAETKVKDSPVNIYFNQQSSCTNTTCNRNISKGFSRSRTMDVHTEARKEFANKNESTYNICRKGSAATQVNLNLFFTDDSTEQKDETVQCCCGYTKEISTFTEDENVTEAELKNPLVVISVFKKHKRQEQSDFDIKVGEAGDVTIVDNKVRNYEPLQKIASAQLDTPLDKAEVVSNKNVKHTNEKIIKARSPATARTVSPLRSNAFKSTAYPKNESTLPLRSSAIPGNERKDAMKGTSSPSTRNSKPRPEASTERKGPLSKGYQNPARSKVEPNLERKKANPRTESSPERNKLSNKADIGPDRSKLSNRADFSPDRNKFSNKDESVFNKNRVFNRADTSPERNKSGKVNTQAKPIKNKELDKKSPYAPISVKPTLQQAGIADKNRTKITFETEKNVSPRKSPVKQDTTDQAKGKNNDLMAAKAKKSLVDTFTRKMTEKMAPMQSTNAQKYEEQAHSGAESTGSRVTVNIDGENEIYDLLFQHDSDTTDLSIRKTRKSRGSPKQTLEQYHDNPSSSLENFLISPENNDRKRSVSQTWNNDNVVSIAPPMENTTAALKVIDSIEVSHRREEKIFTSNNSVKVAQKHFENFAETKEDLFEAPTRHYPGDKCPIVDPMQREMEIRELLGVQKRKRYPTTDPSAASSKVEIISKLSHKDTFHILCPLQKRKINVMVLLNNKAKTDTEAVQSKELIRTNCAQLKSISTQCECLSNLEQCPMVQSIDISENDILQKNKSVSLSIEAYYKVRNLIQRTFAHKKRHRISKKTSVLLCHEILKTRITINRPAFFQKSTQTFQVEEYLNNAINKNKRKQRKIENDIRKEKACTEDQKKDNENVNKKEAIDILSNESKKTIVLFKAKAYSPKVKHALWRTGFPAQTFSAVEIRYADISNTHTEPFANEDTERKPTSNDTFAQGIKRRPMSPNLGVSGLSLCCEAGSVTSTKKPPVLPSRKPKPFLRRLMSCLALKTQKVAKLEKQRSTPKMSTTQSSDWYRVNSSCAPFEMSSSIYDTSASFYTDHAVEPVKSRRGILSSMWNIFTS